MGWRSQDVLRAAALVIAMYLAIRLLWFAYPLVLTTFLGVLFGLAVSSGVDKLEKFGIRRGIAAALIVFGSLGALAGVVAWTAPILREQSRELQTRLPEAIDKLEGWINERGGFIGSLVGGSRATGEAVETAVTGGGSRSPAGQRPDPAAGAPGGEQEAGEQAAARARATGPVAGQDTAAGAVSLRERMGKSLAGAQQYLFGFLTSTVTAIAGIVLVIFLAIYIGAEPDVYHGGMMHLFPHASRNRAGEVLSMIAHTLRRWLRTQLIAMLVIGTVTTVVLLILGIPAAIPLGILAGLFEFIPTVGPILSAIPAVTMGFIDSPQKALTVALVYMAIQFAENNLLIPMLMKEGMDLPPAVTILAQALMALLFGFLGLLVAVPLIAATIVGVKMLYVEDVVGDEVDLGEEDDD